jgi:hypothetical protein
MHMAIPKDQHDAIKSLNIDEHRTVCAYEYWQETFPADTYLAPHIKIIKEALGNDFTRSEVVEFYKRDVNVVTKFIAAMIWGHEAPAGSRRDSRGPWKLSMMFAKPQDAEKAIQSVSLQTKQEITQAYRRLNDELHRCGPNFFTKHFYFLGKSQGINPYPLIFDDRVAVGLIKTALSSDSAMDMVQVSALRKPTAYLKYLAFAEQESDRIGCSLDQIEYYLFNL